MVLKKLPCETGVMETGVTWKLGVLREIQGHIDPSGSKVRKVMAKIIKLDFSRKPPKRHSVPETFCEHKNVIAYTVYRTVRCAFCGTALDPFDVLVDLIQGYVPAGTENNEQHRFEREVSRRKEEKPEDE